MVGALGRSAWVVLFVLGLLELAFGLTLLIVGPAGIPNVIAEIEASTWEEIRESSEEAGLIDYLSRGWGQANIQYGIAVAAIAVAAFRRRARWSWYVLWLVPVSLLITVARNLSLGVTSVVFIDLAEAIVAAVALLLAYPIFFGKSVSAH